MFDDSEPLGTFCVWRHDGKRWLPAGAPFSFRSIAERCAADVRFFGEIAVITDGAYPAPLETDPPAASDLAKALGISL